MSPPLAYVDECGPIAFAAVTGIPRDEAAGYLWGHRWAWLDMAAPHPTASGIYGTPPDAMGDALVRLGFGVELWTGDGRFLADSDVYESYLAGEAHRRVGMVRRHRQRDREDIPHEIEPDPTPERPRLPEWMDRHSGGGWWLVCVTKDHDGHVLAAYGPTILAGGPLARYADWNVYTALRILNPRG